MEKNMNFQFSTNRISTGENNVTFADFIKKHSKTTKTASQSEKLVKTASEEQVSSGQLEVEPLHQEGESTNQGSKKETSSSSASVKKEKEESSGQPEWEGKSENNNEPKVEAKSKVVTKKANLDNLGDKKAEPFGKEDSDKSEEHDSEEKSEEKSEDKEDKEEKKEASSNKFVKISKLTAKDKAFLKDYWSSLFGKDYAEAITSDQ